LFIVVLKSRSYFLDVELTAFLVIEAVFCVSERILKCHVRLYLLADYIVY